MKGEGWAEDSGWYQLVIFIVVIYIYIDLLKYKEYFFICFFFMYFLKRTQDLQRYCGDDLLDAFRASQANSR